MSVIVTKHARKRLKERLGLDKKAIQYAAETAFDKGIRHCETVGNLNKWITSLYFNNRTANNIRIYNDKAWIFAGKNLITVLQVPTSLKESVKDTLNRKEAEKSALDEAKKALVRGDWVEDEKVQKLMGMDFNNCLHIFDFSRIAEWWSVVGKTEEERQRNGQRVTYFFKLKEGQYLDPNTMKIWEGEYEEL